MLVIRVFQCTRFIKDNPKGQLALSQMYRQDVWPRGALPLPMVILNPSLLDMLLPPGNVRRALWLMNPMRCTLSSVGCGTGACYSGFFPTTQPLLLAAGEFPTLQNKMRAILRIEVEAVRFLKEEPHRLDSLLQRVRSMTDILTMLRR